MGKLLRELVRGEALGLGVGLIECFVAAGARGAELEELVDTGHVCLFEALVRTSEGLEPLEVPREGAWFRGEQLGVCRLFVAPSDLVVAGLREEPGVLCEDLEVLLFCVWVNVC